MISSTIRGLLLSCDSCSFEQEFHKRTLAETMDAARRTGWTIVPNKDGQAQDRCPCCSETAAKAKTGPLTFPASKIQ